MSSFAKLFIQVGLGIVAFAMISSTAGGLMSQIIGVAIFAGIFYYSDLNPKMRKKKARAKDNQAEEGRMSRLGNWLAGTLLVGFVLGGYMLHVAKKEMEQEEVAYRQKERERFAALTPEEKAKELALKDKIKNEMAAKAASEAKQAAVEADAKAVAVAGAKSLMAAMKNPDSFQINDVSYAEGGGICYTYRARNSFNAVIQANAVIDSQAKDPKILTSDRDGNRFVSVWNKKCASKSGKDWTDLVQLSIGKI